MNRRLIYAVLVLIIVLLIFNYGNASARSVATVNLVAALCFIALLLYKYSKFRTLDAAIAEANSKTGTRVDDVQHSYDEREVEDRDW